MTAQLLAGLRQNKLEFEGEDNCGGVIGSSECRRVLRFVATASYRS